MAMKHGTLTKGVSATSLARAVSAAEIPDRSWVLTEQRNPRSKNLHALSVDACVRLITSEDARVIHAVRGARGELTAFIEAVAERFVAEPAGEGRAKSGGRARGGGAKAAASMAPGRLIYVGAGTSGRLGVLDASEAPPTFQVPHGRIVGVIAGGDSALRLSSEGKEDDPRGALDALRELRLSARDAVLGIAAGGTTPYVLGALDIAKRLTRGRCVTGLLTCAPIPRPGSADYLIVLRTGPEVLTGSTRMKAGTATKLALNTISTTLMVRSGRVHGNLMVDLRATNMKLRDRAARIVSAATGVDRARALALVARANGSAKCAIVMAWTGCDVGRAERLLHDAGGRLEQVRPRRA